MDAETVVMSGSAWRVDFGLSLILTTQDVQFVLFEGTRFVYIHEATRASASSFQQIQKSHSTKRHP